MVGAVLILGGIAGLAVLAGISYTGDPPVKYDAKVVKSRLDIKKYEGKEYYTYIVTFYMDNENRNISFNVKQKYFDNIVVNDCGVLTCRAKRGKFIAWELKNKV